MTRLNPALARKRADENGAVLALALAFLVAFGTVIGLLLSQVATNLETSTVVESRADRMAAADAGIERAIQRLMIDPTVCVEADSALLQESVNKRKATVACVPSGASNFPVGADGWAAILTGKLDSTGAASKTVSLNGHLYVKGKISGNLADIGGSVVQDPSAPCPANPPIVVSPNPPYKYECKSIPTPDPEHVLPPVPAKARAPEGDDNCRVFFPGKYSAPPSPLANDNYFVSGTYYFENIGQWDIGKRIIAGYNPADVKPPPRGSNLEPFKPCVADPGVEDSAQGSGGSGYGVQWIFGGTSALSLGNNVQVVLHTRVPGPQESSATPGISYRSVQPDEAVPGQYMENTASAVLETKGGHPEFVSMGLLYAREDDVKLEGPNGVFTTLNGGIVAKNLTLKFSHDATVVGLGTYDTGHRYVTLTSTVKNDRLAGDPQSGPDIVATAVVEVRNNTSPPTIAVKSWRTSIKSTG